MLNRLSAVLVATTLVALLANGEDRLKPTTQPLPVVAWGGVPADKATVERFKELAESGININFSGFADVDSTLKALDTAQAAGVKLLVHLPQLKAEPEAVAARLKGHPALFGYYLRDEPDASLFPSLAAWSKALNAVDPDHLCYINLLPTYAIPSQLGTKDYPSYLARYMATVPVRVLSFDHYPMIQGAKGVSLRGDWYDNLEQVAGAARKANVPFWAFALTTRHFSYPTATVANLRCQVFSDLAYGAQGLQYFTYWQITGSSEGAFDDAPINADGSRSAVFDRLKQVNAEARALWPVFAGAKVVDVAHAGETIPAGTHRYVPSAPIKALRSAGPIVVSHLRNGGRDYLVLVNANVEAAVTVATEFDAGAKIDRVGKDGTLKSFAEPAIELEAGDAAILAW